MSSAYDANYIQVVSGPEAIRYRPGLYVGSTDQRGLINWLGILVDIAQDFALLGLCNRIQLTLSDDDFFTFKSDFPAIPVTLSKYRGKEISALELLLTVPRTGCIAVAGYPEGTVLTALCEQGWVEVRHPEGVFRQEYARGVVTTPLQQVARPDDAEAWNNIFCYKPDPEIFATTRFDFDSINQLARLFATTHNGVRFELRDLRENGKTEIIYQFDDGLLALFDTLRQDYRVAPSVPIRHVEQVENTHVEFILQYRVGGEARPDLMSLVNSQSIDFNGEHAIGFWDGLGRIFRAYARQKGWLTANQRLTRQQLSNNLLLVLSLRHPQPIYQGPTKTQGLVNSDIRVAVRRAVLHGVKNWLEQHEAEAKLLFQQVLQKDLTSYPELSSPNQL